MAKSPTCRTAGSKSYGKEDGTMKKIFAFSIAALALLAVSCEKKAVEVIDTPAAATVEKTFTVLAPAETKTALSGTNKVVWSEGDQITVIAKTTGNLATFTLTEGAGTTSAKFSGELAAADAEETEFYSMYPANPYLAEEQTAFAANSSTVEFAKPYSDDSQPLVAVKDSFDPKFANMTAVLDNGAFTFRHASAYFKITIGEDNIKSIKISASGAARIYGRQVVTIETGAVGTVNGSGSSKNFITLAPAEGTFEKGGVYYIPFSIKSGSSFGNITLTATNTSDIESEITTTSLSSKKPGAGLIYNFKTPPFVFSADPELTLKTASIDDVTATAASGLTASGAYVVKNCTDTDVAVTFDGTVVTAASISGGTVTYSVSENTGEARQGWIGLQLAGGEVQKITVNQVAAGTATELVPITAATIWSADNWADMKGKKGTNAVKEDLLFDNIQFVHGGGSGIKFNDTYAQLAGSGSATKCCLQFKVAGAGKVEITCKSGNSSNDRTLKVAVGSVVTDISAPGASQNTGTVNVSGAGTVCIYSGGSGINIFTIKWTPQ